MSVGIGRGQYAMRIAQALRAHDGPCDLYVVRIEECFTSGAPGQQRIKQAYAEWAKAADAGEFTPTCWACGRTIVGLGQVGAIGHIVPKSSQSAFGLTAVMCPTCCDGLGAEEAAAKLCEAAADEFGIIVQEFGRLQ